MYVKIDLLKQIDSNSKYQPNHILTFQITHSNMIPQNDLSIDFRQSVQQVVSNHLGDYEVAQELNHGSYGHVFKIKDRKSKHIFAMKVLFCTHTNSESKIKNQINIHQSLKNRYILRINNSFCDRENTLINYYMILEYCQKGDLQSYIRKNYPDFNMPLEEFRKIAQQIAKGISYIHKQDIVHGDIKLNNILINQKDQVKICDFGFSTKRKNKEKVNGVKGTLNYLAPQCMLPYDQKVDVWAFGVMLYYICTGMYPFNIQNYKKLTEVLREERLKKLQFPVKIGPKLKDLLQKIFVIDPLKRYSIADVLNHPFITGQEIILKQPSYNSEEEQHMQRIRSYTSTTIESNKKSDSLKMIHDVNSENPRYRQKRPRPNTQNKNYDSKKAKENYLGRLLENKTKEFRKYSDFDKENKINSENVKTQLIKKTQAKLKEKQRKMTTQKQINIKTMKSMQKNGKKSIQPLNTQGMIIKPIIQKNSITKIDNQGICRIRQEMDEQGNKILKEIKISPDGENVYMKLDRDEKFYKLQNLPEKHFKDYENCKKYVNLVKNHTPKIVFQKKNQVPIYKEVKLTVMYSGKVICEINGYKIQTTEKELQEDCVTFADDQQKFIISELSVKNEIKSLYHKIIAI